MKKLILLSAAASTLLLSPALQAGTFSTYQFADDASSLIGTAGQTGPGVTYGASNVIVNGVTFTGTNSSTGSVGAATYALGNVTNQFGGYAPPGISGAVASLGNNFFFDGDTPETLTLSNLTPNQSYNLDFYNFQFGSPGGRPQNVTDDQAGAIASYDENQSSGSVLQDSFVAPANGTLVVTFLPLTTNASEHQYDFQLTPTSVPEPSALVALLGGAATLIGFRRRRA